MTASLARCLRPERGILWVGIPRAMVWWVVCEERSQRRPGSAVAAAERRARKSRFRWNRKAPPRRNRLRFRRTAARRLFLSGVRKQGCSGAEGRWWRSMGNRGLIDRLYSEIGKPIRGGPKARPQRRLAGAVPGAFQFLTRPAGSCRRKGKWPRRLHRRRTLGANCPAVSWGRV